MPRPMHGALCVGLYSSASTWLYNLLSLLLAEHALRYKKSLTSLYADDMNQLGLRSLVNEDAFVIKSHRPSDRLIRLTQSLSVPMFLTLREPRDAVTSLMDRFGTSFEQTLADVAASASRLRLLAQHPDSMCLRFEDRFFSRSAVVSNIAARLALDTPSDIRKQIERSVSRSAITLQIAQADRRGAFKTVGDAEEMLTQWHRDHVGDGRSGKWPRRLSASQAATVRAATASYRRMFGY